MLLNPSEAIERSSSSGAPPRCDPFEIAISCTSGRSFVLPAESAGFFGTFSLGTLLSLASAVALIVYRAR